MSCSWEVALVNRFSILDVRHEGERGVLVANGPSLNRMDLSLLHREVVIGTNKIYLGFRKFGFYPKYYVAVNPKVLEQSAERIRGLNCVKFLSDRSAGFLSEDGLTYHIQPTRAPAPSSPPIRPRTH